MHGSIHTGKFKAGIVSLINKCSQTMLQKQTLSWQGVPKPSLAYRLPWRAVPLKNFSCVSHCTGKKVFCHQLKFLTGET